MDISPRPVISATGLYTPPQSISNAELVASFNAYAARHNAEHADAIAAGTRTALETAGREPGEVDAVLCAASNMQRAYPAMAIEIQHALGIDGFGFDMNVACSSATFGIQTAADYIRAGHAKSVLVVS